MRLPNTTLCIQRLDVEDVCDITDVVLDALTPPAAGAGLRQHAGAGLRQHAGVTGGAVRVCAARATAAGTGHGDLSWRIATR